MGSTLKQPFSWCLFFRLRPSLWWWIGPIPLSTRGFSTNRNCHSNSFKNDWFKSSSSYFCNYQKIKIENVVFYFIKKLYSLIKIKKVFLIVEIFKFNYFFNLKNCEDSERLMNTMNFLYNITQEFFFNLKKCEHVCLPLFVSNRERRHLTLSVLIMRIGELKCEK